MASFISAQRFQQWEKSINLSRTGSALEKPNRYLSPLIQFFNYLAIAHTSNPMAKNQKVQSHQSQEDIRSTATSIIRSPGSPKSPLASHGTAYSANACQVG